MQISPHESDAAPSPEPIGRPWWQRSVWWPASLVLLVLGTANAPAAYLLAGNSEGIWRTLAWCGVGSVMAQLMLFALILGSTAETWGRRLTRAYPVALLLFAITASSWYFQAAYTLNPHWSTPYIRTHELIVRRDMGGVILLAVESLVIGVFVAILLCDHYQARFVHRVVPAKNRLGNPPTNERVKWTLRDMLVWTTLLAITFGLARFIPWHLTLSPTEGFLGGIICTVILGWLCCFISLAAIMELYVHSPRSEAVWKHKYNWYLFTLLAALVAFDGTGLLADIESTACRVACAFFAFCGTIALAIAALEWFGWQLLVSSQPKKRQSELIRPLPHDLLDP
jgi:hypothetical protein